jgi:hypothetical protein
MNLTKDSQVEIMQKATQARISNNAMIAQLKKKQAYYNVVISDIHTMCTEREKWIGYLKRDRCILEIIAKQAAANADEILLTKLGGCDKLKDTLSKRYSDTDLQEFLASANADWYALPKPNGFNNNGMARFSLSQNIPSQHNTHVPPSVQDLLDDDDDDNVHGGSGGGGGGGGYTTSSPSTPQRRMLPPLPSRQQPQKERQTRLVTPPAPTIEQLLDDDDTTAGEERITGEGGGEGGHTTSSPSTPGTSSDMGPALSSTGGGSSSGGSNCECPTLKEEEMERRIKENGRERREKLDREREEREREFRERRERWDREREERQRQRHLEEREERERKEQIKIEEQIKREREAERETEKLKRELVIDERIAKMSKIREDLRLGY